MSEENLEIVRRCYGLWAERDFSRITEVADPDIVVDLSRNVFNPGVHAGIAGFRRFVEQVFEVWQKLDIELKELIDAGDRVVAAIRMSGQGRGSGVEVDTELFAIWTLRNGKVVRMEGGYRDRAEALAAAGLP